jgi:hypothetical protein
VFIFDIGEVLYQQTMKNYTVFTLAPILALLAFGCSSPSSMQSSEYDDMYYSSSDRTEYASPEVRTQENNYQEDTYDEANGEVQNNEYSRSRSSTSGNYQYDEYYDGRSYDPGYDRYRPNYSFVDPYWGSAYTPRMYNSFGFNNSFNDPFFDPFMYNSFFYPFGYNSLSINYNYSWGGWNNPFPYWNRSSMYYSRLYPHNAYYHGFYNGYHNGLYAGQNWYFDRPFVYGNPIKTQYGPRDDRGVIVIDNPGGTIGRPMRGEAFEGDISGTDNARVTRQPRGGEATMQPENGADAKEALPARPSRTEYYDPSRRSRSEEQPARVREEQERRVQPEERREIRSREYTPREGNTRTREYNPRSRENNTRENKIRTSEQSAPQQQRKVERPTYERRHEYSPPPTQSIDRRDNSSSSSSNSSSSGSNSNESQIGGRPSRGQ